MTTDLLYNRLMAMVTQYNTTLLIEVCHSIIKFFSANTYGATLTAVECQAARVVRGLVLQGREIFFVAHRRAQLPPVAQTDVIIPASIVAEYKWYNIFKEKK